MTRRRHVEVELQLLGIGALARRAAEERAQAEPGAVERAREVTTATLAAAHVGTSSTSDTAAANRFQVSVSSSSRRRPARVSS